MIVFKHLDALESDDLMLLIESNGIKLMILNNRPSLDSKLFELSIVQFGFGTSLKSFSYSKPFEFEKKSKLFIL